MSVIQFIAYLNTFVLLQYISRPVLDAFINLLSSLGIIHWCLRVHNFLNIKLTFFGYKVFIIFLAAAFLCYLSVARYIFYLRVSHLAIPWYLFFVFVFLSFLVLLKSFCNFSWFFIPFLFANFPQYLPFTLYVHEYHPEDNPEADVNPSPTPTKRFSVIDRSRTTNNHYYPNGMSRGSYSRNTGLILGACYHYRLSALAAIRQADAAEKGADVAA
jgi:hypothetical protein